MRKIIYLLTAAIPFLMSCSDEDTSFDSGVGASAFSFEPVAGGAVMRYDLPADPDIVGVNVRYTDPYGKQILRTASCNIDTMLLSGFNQAQQTVVAKVTLCHRNHSESLPIDVTFSTKDSAPVQFLNTASVNSGWNGFFVDYTAPENSQGTVHVFYLGKRKEDSVQKDTILLSSFTLESGENIVNFVPKFGEDQNTVVLRVEDFRGHMIGEKTFENVVKLTPTLLHLSPEQFYCETTIEDKDSKFGKEYLFDGDKNGSRWFETSGLSHFYTFAAGPHAVGNGAAPMYLDLKSNRILAELRMYSMQAMGQGCGPNFYKGIAYTIFNAAYKYRLPCDVVLYGAKDDNKGNSDWDSKEWKELGTFSQPFNANSKEAWYGELYASAGGGTATNKEQAEAMESKYMNITISVKGQDEGYRYLKIVINNTFNPPSGGYWGYNDDGYVSFHELEVWSD